MKRYLIIIILSFLTSGCASSQSKSNDPFRKHFAKPYTIMWGPTVKIAAHSNTAIGYWFDRRYVKEYELKSHATQHCKSHNKSINEGQFVYHQAHHSSAIFKCINL